MIYIIISGPAQVDVAAGGSYRGQAEQDDVAQEPPVAGADAEARATRGRRHRDRSCEPFDLLPWGGVVSTSVLTS